MTTEKTRVCVIGAGPSGMSVLYQFAQIGTIPDVVCFEKQKTWGGIWNSTWRTGLDENNEHCHSSLYKHLWTNAPKEANLEYPDYPFEKHFGKPVPSYLPAPALRDYLEGRWTKAAKQNLKRFIEFNTVIRYVRYDVNKKHFIVTVDNREKNEARDEIFSHVIVCAGIFNFPNQPEIPGVNEFEGRIMHSHNFRSGAEFKGQTLLVIGGSYSADDVALQSIKFGAKKVIISCRGKPTNINWPEGVVVHPGVEIFDAKHAYFQDGTKTTIDAVVYCTGYKNHFPFLETKLRIPEDTAAYPAGLYKGSLFVGHGDHKLFYVGVQNQIYSMTYFDSIALWICKYIMGQLPGEPKTHAEMVAETKKWEERGAKVTNALELFDLHTELLDQISDATGYTKLIQNARPYFEEWLKNRSDDMATFRDHQFRSMYTGTLAPPSKQFMKAYDDSLKTFLKN